MPRKPRVYLGNIPAHIVHRGHNRDACFFSDEDYLYYLECLYQGCRRYTVQLHAYVLMTNHVHLLMTPADEAGISRVMQHIGRLYVRHINQTYRRSGSLWEGRHKASLIEAENYLLTCYRYIELNPVAANMVAFPEDYRWSSYQHHACGLTNPNIIEHDVYVRLGSSSTLRSAAYSALFSSRIPQQDITQIQKSIKYNYPLGSDRFRQQIEIALNKSVGYSRLGRPARR